MSVVDVDEAEYDPFDFFNRNVGIGAVENPYPLFAFGRAKGLVKEDIAAEFGLESPGAAAGADAPPVYTAYTYDAVQSVLRDGDVFSSAAYADVMGMVMGHSILEMDEPEHHERRGLVQHAFTRKAMETWERDAITPIIDEHIDAFVDDHEAELVRQLTFPFPVHVIARMLGLPSEDLPQFHRWAIELISVAWDWDRGIAASEALKGYFGAILEARRKQPGNDVISILAHVEQDGERLTDEDIFAFLRLLLPAGAETTYRSSSNLLVGLLTNPDQLDALRADRSLMNQAIEEGLRWEPPLLTILRTAAKTVDVCGTQLNPGDVVIVNMGSANHDDKYWPDPERFDIFRPQKNHIAFASGPHMCLGMHLARMETRIVLEKLFDRLPNLRLDPKAPAPEISGMTFRAPAAIHVVWD